MFEAQKLEPARCAELIRRSSLVVALTGARDIYGSGHFDFGGPNGLNVTPRLARSCIPTLLC